MHNRGQKGAQNTELRGDYTVACINNIATHDYIISCYDCSFSDPASSTAINFACNKKKIIIVA